MSASAAAAAVASISCGLISQGFVGVLPAVLGALCGMLQASEELDTQTQVREIQEPGVLQLTCCCC
jgi:hypothetical protein